MDKIGFCTLQGIKGTEAGWLFEEFKDGKKVYWIKNVGAFIKRRLPGNLIDLYIEPVVSDFIDASGNTGFKYYQFPFDIEGNINNIQIDKATTNKLKSQAVEIENLHARNADLLRIRHSEQLKETRNKEVLEAVDLSAKLKNKLFVPPGDDKK